MYNIQCLTVTEGIIKQINLLRLVIPTAKSKLKRYTISIKLYKVMGPRDKSTLNPLAMEKLAMDGRNWPLWQATMRSFFESKNLIRHIEGTAVRPPPPPPFAATPTITEEEDAHIERAEDRMEKFLAREGLVKSQVIMSVSKPLALMLQKKKYSPGDLGCPG